MNAGIYEIRNVVSGQRYIGSTCALNVRFLQHRSGLRKGTHDNQYLQSAWNKYGESAFVYRILAVLERHQTVETEQRFLDCLSADGECLYNMAPFANSGMRGRSHSDESRAALSASVRKTWSDPTLKQQQSERVKRRYEDDPTWRERTSQTSKELWEKHGDMMRERVAAGVRTPAAREKQASSGRLRFAREGERQKHSEAVTKALLNPIARAKISESNIARYQDPAARQKMSEALKGRTFSDETRARMSDARKLAWADPEIRARMVAGLQSAKRAKSTSGMDEFERAMREFFRKIAKG